MTHTQTAALLLAVALAPATGFAHAYPAQTTPAKDATLSTAPTQVSIEFDDELEPKYSSIVVHDAGGHVVSAGPAQAVPKDAKQLTVALKPLAPGRYTVNWAATDTDTHKTKGSFSFTVAK